MSLIFSCLPYNIDHTKDETVLTPHGKVAAMSITGNRVLFSGNAEEGVHLAERADQVRVCVCRKQDYKARLSDQTAQQLIIALTGHDDGEKNRSVRVVLRDNP